MFLGPPRGWPRPFRSKTDLHRELDLPRGIGAGRLQEGRFGLEAGRVDLGGDSLLSEYKLPGVIGEAVIGHVHPLVVAVEGVEALGKKLELEALVGEQLAGKPQVGGRVIGTGEAVAARSRQAVAVGIGVAVGISDDARVKRASASRGDQA